MQMLHIMFSLMLATLLSAPTNNPVSETAEARRHSFSLAQEELAGGKDAVYCEIECPDGRKLKCRVCNCQKPASSCGSSE